MIEQATFAAGCFWGVEGAFQKLKGVTETRVGYTGGTLENPSYQQVCSGSTGHAEAVNLKFDSDVVTFERLVEIFFQIHDPTTLNRQGPDTGTQYRSEIFTHSDDQVKISEAVRKEFQKRWESPIVTAITPFSTFYDAEEYHQKYFEKQGH